MFKTMIILLFLAASACSCQKWVDKQLEKKYEPDCKTGNCMSVNIKGSLLVKPSGEGLKNIPVEVYFERNSSAWIPEKRKVVSGKTNKNGDFDFKVTINTKSFEDYHLYVRIPEQKNYISATRPYGEFIWRNFDSYDEDELKENIIFEFYKKAIFTINFIRKQTDYFDSFSCNISISGSRGIWNMNEESIKLTNGIVQLETVADVYTIIQWTKYLNYNKVECKSDSLICRQNSNNIININY